MKLKGLILIWEQHSKMQILKKNYLYLFSFFLFQGNLSADSAHYLDFKFILNESKAGKGSTRFFKK